MIRFDYFLKKDGYLFALMLITVPLAGELKFYPLNEAFRISFGAPAFFFFLLLLRHVPAVLSGLLTGAAVVLFRIGLECLGGGHAGFMDAFYSQYSSFFFYFTYACLFHVLKVGNFRDRPFMIGFLGFLIEIASDVIELAVQFSDDKTMITPEKLTDIAVISVSHTFIVLSFFNVMKLYETQVREKQTRKQHEHMLMIVSNLYEETIHLKKTLKTTEHVTNESYQLYREVSGDNQELGKRMLRLAGEIHEVKKDNQRIFAGLSKLISNERFRDYMNAAALIGLVIRINEKYAESLGKDIAFQCTIEGDHPDYHVFTVLSIMNNVAANAVEAMGDKGEIRLGLRKAEGDMAEFQAEDNGPGIPEKIGEIVYDPGFTSKYDEFGTPSTGIGLSYVKEIVTELDGDISFHNKPKGVIFTIKLPMRHLIAERMSS
ncbi:MULTISPECIES: sensor histidine kinase [unclassified Bacillus (in: firmicutes)]|uniref:sensor histidine kinase n=1 Tax=unclassified Bacillus (in: firmicutes) TaxID=185979 RepID=UPI002889CBDD|nr:MULTISPECIES: sensor histidine kinase [unclassified Bacillus (in: firmicutes)]